MNDNIEGIKIIGSVCLDGNDIYKLTYEFEVDSLLRKNGMVFQRSNLFLLSIFENVAFGLRIHKLAKGSEIKEIVEASLRSFLLWDELKDKLHASALILIFEQQQRLCIACLLTVKPGVILLDESCSS